MQTLNNNQKWKIPSHLQAQFVQTLDNAIHWINHAKMDFFVITVFFLTGLHHPEARF